VLSDRTEALSDVSTTTPPSKPTTSKLLPLIRDELSRHGAAVADRATKKCSHCCGVGLLSEYGEVYDPSREVINGEREPPTEGPALRQGERQPCGPESKGGGHGRQVEVPFMIRTLGGDDSRVDYRCLNKASSRSVPQHAAHRCPAEMEIGPAEDLSHLGLSHGRTEDLESPDDVADEVGELVYGFTELEDGPSFNRGVMGTTLSWDAGHARILDARFLTQKRQFLAMTLVFLLQSDAGIPVVDGPAAGSDEGEVGQGIT
jgi:hypothetical protein